MIHARGAALVAAASIFYAVAVVHHARTEVDRLRGELLRCDAFIASPRQLTTPRHLTATPQAPLPTPSATRSSLSYSYSFFYEYFEFFDLATPLPIPVPSALPIPAPTPLPNPA